MIETQITKLGVLTALKNLGAFFAINYSVTSIKANPEEFIFAMLVYALVSVPSDLYLLNKAHENGLAEKKETE